MTTPSSPTTPRQRRHARTRQAILDAARQLIGERGVEGLSMRELAQRIDYSPAGLYEYFDGKDDIVAAVCEEGRQRFTRALATAGPELPPLQRLEALGRAYVDFALAHPERFLLMFASKAGRPPERDERGESTAESYQILLDAVQSALDAGLIAERPGHGREDIAYGCWSLAHGAAMLRVAHFQGIRSERLDAAERVNIRAYLEGLAP